MLKLIGVRFLFWQFPKHSMVALIASHLWFVLNCKIQIHLALLGRKVTLLLINFGCYVILSLSLNFSELGNVTFMVQNTGDAASRDSTLTYVINKLIQDSNQPALSSDLDDVKCTSEVPVPLSFYMCMANVLISACQKILDSGRKPFARKTIPCLIRSVKVFWLFIDFRFVSIWLLISCSAWLHSCMWCQILQVMTNPEVRAACVEVLFSSVYHLKAAILPYSTDLLEVSLKALRKGSEKVLDTVLIF